MDWFKVKTKHFFHDGFDKTTGWAWIRIMALVSEIESMPTEAQILKTITKKEYDLLQKHFNNLSNSLQKVIEKVLEDAKNLKCGREYWKEKKRQQRQKKQNVHGDVLGDGNAIKEKEKEKENPPTPQGTKSSVRQCKNVAEILTFINTLKLDDFKKRDIRIQVQSVAKTLHTMSDLYALVESSLPATSDSQKEFIQRMVEKNK